MSETTEGKSVPEALRMIAQWIVDGREIEVYEKSGDKWSLKHRHNFYMEGNIYRAKPRKPRTCDIFLFADDLPLKIVELTPEVRACLEKEGLLP